MTLPIMIIYLLEGAFSIVSSIYNEVKAYYLSESYMSTTDKILPVIANVDQNKPDIRNKVFFIISSIMILLPLLMFFLI